MTCTAKDVVERAGTLAEKGQFPEAIAALEAFISKGRSADAVVYETLAQCYLLTDRPVEAYDAAAAALRGDADWLDGHVTLARAARNAGYLEEALRAFSRALRLGGGVDVEAEMAEVRELRCRVVAERSGISFLRIFEDFGGGHGPGGVIWEAAFYLISHLTARFPSIKGRRVLELGSGTGIVGIACALRGAHVRLTDLADLLPLMEQNLRNHQQKFDEEASGSCTCQVMRWDEPVETVLQESWDLVIGADLVYAQTQIPSLLNILRPLRKLPRPVCIAHKSRSDEIDRELFQQLNALGILPTANIPPFHILSG